MGLFNDCLKISSSTIQEFSLSFPLDATDIVPLRDDDFEVYVEDDDVDEGDGPDGAFCDRMMDGFSAFCDCAEDNDVIGGGGGGGPSSNDSYCGAGPSLIEE